MKMRLTVTAVTVLFALGVAAGALFLSGALTTRAVQNPSMSIDMVTTGNAYVPGTAETPGASLDPWTDAADNQCGVNRGVANNIDDDADGVVNDGCPAVGGPGGATANPDPETGVQCGNNVDDDSADDLTDPANTFGFGLVNDGCRTLQTMTVGAINNSLTGSTNVTHTHT